MLLKLFKLFKLVPQPMGNVWKFRELFCYVMNFCPRFPQFPPISKFKFNLKFLSFKRSRRWSSLWCFLKSLNYLSSFPTPLGNVWKFREFFSLRNEPKTMWRGLRGVDEEVGRRRGFGGGTWNSSA